MKSLLTAFSGLSATWLTTLTITDYNEILSAIISVIVGVITVFKLIKEKTTKKQ